MYDFIYKKWFLLQKCGVWWGWEKNREKMNTILDVQIFWGEVNMVSRGVLEHHDGCCNHSDS